MWKLYKMQSLMGQRHTHWLTSCLWLLSPYSGRVAATEAYDLKNLKYFLFDPMQKRCANSWYKGWNLKFYYLGVMLCVLVCQPLKWHHRISFYFLASYWRLRFSDIANENSQDIQVSLNLKMTTNNFFGVSPMQYAHVILKLKNCLLLVKNIQL